MACIGNPNLGATGGSNLDSFDSYCACSSIWPVQASVLLDSPWEFGGKSLSQVLNTLKRVVIIVVPLIAASFCAGVQKRVHGIRRGFY